MIRTIEVERFSLISSKPFDQVVAVLYASIGHPDMAEFGRSTSEANSFAELKRAVEKGLSGAGLMLFMQLDHGAVVRKQTGRDTPRIIRFVIGNPLIMMEMAKHVPDAGSYAPVTVLVDERADGVGQPSGFVWESGCPRRGSRLRLEDRDPSSRVCGVNSVYDHQTMYLGQHGRSADAPVSRSRMGRTGPR